MADPQDDEKDEEWMKEVYGKEYTGPPKPSDLKDRDNGTVKKRTASDNESDEDEKNRDPNAIPTGFTSREAKVWESKAKSIERNWKRKKEEELTCRICGEKGHFTQGCPTTLGVNRRSRGGAERTPTREKNFKPRFTGSGGSRGQGTEKDTGYRFEHDNHHAGGRDAYHSHASRTERARGSKPLGFNKRAEQVDEFRDEAMGRQGSSRGSNANSLVAAQMQHIAAQRMQHSSGSQHYPSMPDVPPIDMEQHYTSSQGDGHWKWEGRGPPDPVSGNISPSKVRGPDGASPYYHGQMPDSIPSDGNNALPKESNQKLEVDAGFEDQTLPKSFEAFEQKLMDEVMKLTKQQDDAEDDENTWHRERTREIHEQFQAKLVALRAQHAKRREEFLCHEMQTRVDQYRQPASSKQYHESGGGPMHGYKENLNDNRGYSSSVADGHQGYPGGYDARRDEMQYYGNPPHTFNRNQSYDMREAFSGSRMYESAQRYR
ncbi:hypothetical protein SUGI_1008460 [Cryptomeria japonica]|uniref:uncharacterized protein LOC131073554 isoform X2 n=1 Tax=Cryptomeria japonica TaxID=3369 RepID=UPI002414A336|nr:uncharacterized protein LOC131073554 isoform X2 [Cryptomeria japonica]GLJ47747.1 hypothetical protein SUGI_1008460 [Cryptomeria japonica]